MSKTSSIGAPVGGWNVRDGLQSMKPGEAVYMENWWPTPTDLQIRKGYVPWAIGLLGTVDTLIPYNGLSGVRKLFAFTSTGSVYDVSAQGAVGSALVTGLTNGRWQYVAYSTTGGDYVLACNGADDMLRYDGTTWLAITATDITGVDPKTIISINVFKSRIWLVPKNSLSAWYLPALAIQGAATEFPLGSFFPMGGRLQAMGTWTIDVGIGIDDNCAFFSSEGEILIYQGTDPSSVTTFALIGLFRQGAPIGTRCQIKYLGDVYVITDHGVSPMSKSILTAQVTTKSDLTDKILPAMQQAVSVARGSFGWQMIAYAAANMLLVNVPSVTNYQFAMNTITGAWTKFTGWNAQCWEVQGNALYFGGTGMVGLAWSTNGDNSMAIVADCLPAFSSFQNGTQLKKMSMVRPILYSDGSPSVLIGINYDYDQTSQPTGSLSFGAVGGGMTWGSMTWGSMTWGGSLVANKNWQFAGGIGYSVSMRIKVTNNVSEVRWASTDYVYALGGVM